MVAMVSARWARSANHACRGPCRVRPPRPGSPCEENRHDRPPRCQRTRRRRPELAVIPLRGQRPGPRSWHAWRTGTPAGLAAARMQATAANRASCHKSPACHPAASSSRSGPVPPGKAAAASTAYWSLAFGRPRKVHPGRNRSRRPCQGQRVSPAGPVPVQRVRGEVEEHHAGEGAVPRVQGRKLAHQPGDVSVAGEPAEDMPGGHGVLRGRPLPGRHITAVKAEPPVAGRPYRRMPAAGQCSAVTPPARHAASLHHELHDARQPICIA